MGGKLGERPVFTRVRSASEWNRQGSTFHTASRWAMGGTARQANRFDRQLMKGVQPWQMYATVVLHIFMVVTLQQAFM